MIFLSLGSNLGDRSLYLTQARAMLSVALKTKLLCSPVIETLPAGQFKSDVNPFLNQVAAFSNDEVHIGPNRLLHICKMIEKSLGRAVHEAEFGPDGKRIYQGRNIDIDILFFDDIVMFTPELTIPHLALPERPFFDELIREVKMEHKPVWKNTRL